MGEKLVYNKETIDRVINILDTMNVKGVSNASALVTIYSLLNTPLQEEIENLKNE